MYKPEPEEHCEPCVSAQGYLSCDKPHNDLFKQRISLGVYCLGLYAAYWVLGYRHRQSRHSKSRSFGFAQPYEQVTADGYRRDSSPLQLY